MERRARERKRKQRAALASGKPFANVSSKLRHPASHALEYALVPVYERRDTETEAGDDHGRIATAKSRSDSFSRISRENLCVSLLPPPVHQTDVHAFKQDIFFRDTYEWDFREDVDVFSFFFFLDSSLLPWFSENRFFFSRRRSRFFSECFSRLVRLGVFNITFYIILREGEWVKGYVVSFGRFEWNEFFFYLVFLIVIILLLCLSMFMDLLIFNSNLSITR